MGIVQERTEKVNDLKEQVTNHCMCLEFEEDSYYYIVFFPEGYFPNGVRCSKEIGKAIALQKILDNMEKVWKESFP
jgi:hypothetical protein